MKEETIPEDRQPETGDADMDVGDPLAWDADFGEIESLMGRVSEEEVRRFLEGPVKLSPEDEAALARSKPELMRRIARLCASAKAKEVRDKVTDEVGDEVGDEVKDKVRDKVTGKVGDEVKDD